MLPPDARHADVRKLGLTVAKVIMLSSSPAEGIASFTADNFPDLIVMGPHQRHGMDRFWHPSVAEPVARKNGAMTLFVPRGVEGFVDQATGKVRLRQILIPINRSPDPQLAIVAATLLARILDCQDTRFVLFYAGHEGKMPEVELTLQRDWTTEYRSWSGNVVDHILASAETDKADLIVMATRGHDGVLDNLRGSTTERVLHRTPCPLLTLPSHAALD
jgi:nucleotide-binding universal stress UspA family protein